MEREGDTENGAWCRPMYAIVRHLILVSIRLVRNYVRQGARAAHVVLGIGGVVLLLSLFSVRSALSVIHHPQLQRIMCPCPVLSALKVRSALLPWLQQISAALWGEVEGGRLLQRPSWLYSSTCPTCV